MRELDYLQIEDFVEAMDIVSLAQRAVEDPQDFYWLSRELRAISPATHSALLEAIKPAGMADVCRSEEATAQTLGHLLRASTEHFGQRFLQQLSAKDVAAIFDRSPLGHVGSLIQHWYPQFEEGYTVFKEQNLARKLAAEPLDEIGKFIHRVHQAPGVGEHIAREALDILVVTDLSEPIASTDLELFAVLLYTANAVDGKYPSRLLLPLGQPEIVRAAIENSGIRGIELLILNVANMDEHYLQDIRQALEVLDLTDQLAIADVEDLGHFLWNVFAHIDEGLSREYCYIIDKQQRSERLQDAPLKALCRFLWNLIQISDLSELKTLHDPMLKERLVSSWESEIGRGAQLLGIVATTQPYGREEIQLQPIDAQAEERLADWVTWAVQQRHPYLLSLTLRGLQVYDVLQARALVRRFLPMVDAYQLLKNAMASAATPRSVALLEETLRWLEELSTSFDTE